jgi:hypothetical protein
MRIDRVTGLLGMGQTPVELHPGRGLIAVLGDGRARQAAQTLVMNAVAGTGRHRRRLVRDAHVQVTLRATGESLDLGPGSVGEAQRQRLLAVLGLDAASLALLWAGGVQRDVSSTVRESARLVANRGGLGRVEAALDALTGLPGVAEALAEFDDSLDTGTQGSPGNGVGAARLARVERELGILRADAAELQGDLDEATMEWLRERQDAETTLLAYRDRARELKSRLGQLEAGGPGTACPTCGRELEDHYDGVVTELREEWESVVQDGQWWKRRLAQLDPKPERVRELESRALRFQAAIEEAAERAEHLRTAMGVRGPDSPGGSPSRAVPEPLLRAARDLKDPAQTAVALSALGQRLLVEARTVLLSATSRVLNRLSGGRLIGLDAPEGPHGPLVPRPVAGAPGQEDLAAAQVAAHLALAETLGGDEGSLGSLLIGEPFATLEEEDQLRGVVILRRMRRRFPQILVLPGSGVVDAVPEAFDAVWEFRPAPEPGFPALRSLPVGVGAIAVGS